MESIVTEFNRFLEDLREREPLYESVLEPIENELEILEYENVFTLTPLRRYLDIYLRFYAEVDAMYD